MCAGNSSDMRFVHDMRFCFSSRLSKAQVFKRPEKFIKRLIFKTGPDFSLQSIGLELVLVSGFVEVAFRSFSSAGFKKCAQ